MNASTVIDIQLCLGSACFARGNRDALAELNRFIQQEHLTDKVTVRGSLCEGRCKEGPIVKINGTSHTRVNGATLVEIVKRIIDGSGQ